MEVAAYMGSVAKSVSVLVRGKAPFENILGIKIGSMIKKVKHYTCTYIWKWLSLQGKHIGGVMASVLASYVVDLGLNPWSGQTKDNKIGICYFSAKHTTLRQKGKDWLARNQDNMSEWGDMSTRRLLFQWALAL